MLNVVILHLILLLLGLETLGAQEYPTQLLQQRNLATLQIQDQYITLNSLANTPVKSHVLNQLLYFYPNKQDALVLQNGFSYGFKLNFEGPRQDTTCQNLKSISCLEKEAIDIVMKEVNLGRIAGPFVAKPLPVLRLSPVGLVPKKMVHGV